MSISIDLLKAPHYGVRELKNNLSAKLLKQLSVITDRGKPVSVNLPYPDMLELLDILDGLSDDSLVREIIEGRKAIESGEEGAKVSDLFNKIMKAVEALGANQYSSDKK